MATSEGDRRKISNGKATTPLRTNELLYIKFEILKKMGDDRPNSDHRQLSKKSQLSAQGKS